MKRFIVLLACLSLFMFGCDKAEEKTESTTGVVKVGEDSSFLP